MMMMKTVTTAGTAMGTITTVRLMQLAFTEEHIKGRPAHLLYARINETTRSLVLQSPPGSLVGPIIPLYPISTVNSPAHNALPNYVATYATGNQKFSKAYTKALDTQLKTDNRAENKTYLGDGIVTASSMILKAYPLGFRLPFRA